jgi:hypothetical protein
MPAEHVVPSARVCTRAAPTRPVQLLFPHLLAGSTAVTHAAPTATTSGYAVLLCASSFCLQSPVRAVNYVVPSACWPAQARHRCHASRPCCCLCCCGGMPSTRCWLHLTRLICWYAWLSFLRRILFFFLRGCMLVVCRFSLFHPSAVIPCRTRQIPIRTLKLSYIGPR